MKKVDEIRILRSKEEISTIKEFWHQMNIHANTDPTVAELILETRQNGLGLVVFAAFVNEKPGCLLICRIEKVRISTKFGLAYVRTLPVTCLYVLHKGLIGDTRYAPVLIKKMMNSLGILSVHVVHFGMVDVDEELFRMAKRASPKFRLPVTNRREAHWKMQFPPSIESFYGRFSSKHRYNLRRLSRRMEKEYPNRLKTVFYNSEEKIGDMFSLVEKVAAETYHRKIGVGFVANEEQRSLLLARAKRQWMITVVLLLDDEPICFWIATIYKHVLYLHHTGYKDQYRNFNVGIMLLLSLFEKAIEVDNHIYMVDFGYGDADYKRTFGTELHHEETVLVFSSKFLAGIENFIQFSLNGISTLIDRVVMVLGVREKLKFWRRKKLSK
jgi:hypothetical protein